MLTGEARHFGSPLKLSWEPWTRPKAIRTAVVQRARLRRMHTEGTVASKVRGVIPGWEGYAGGEGLVILKSDFKKADEVLLKVL